MYLSKNAILVLEDGSFYKGYGAGAMSLNVGELCFNTSITGYQESITDPSYDQQIIAFTFPHIGNTGINEDDYEMVSLKKGIGCKGIVISEPISKDSSWRSKGNLNSWLEKKGIVAISGIDTRALTIKVRDEGHMKAVIYHNKNGDFDVDKLVEKAKNWKGIDGKDLALEMTQDKSYNWNSASWKIENGYKVYDSNNLGSHVVVIDYGIKKNILCKLVDQGFKVSIVNANTSADEVLKLNPDGVLLSNGPGDPRETAKYALDTIKRLIEKQIPLFGICLGHQLLALALGAKIIKMFVGHRGANHPVKDLNTGVVEITSQNHGFVVDNDSLPSEVVGTHYSLFDGTLAGFEVNSKNIFSVQYHPEASPGPKDSEYLFERFRNVIKENKN